MHRNTKGTRSIRGLRWNVTLTGAWLAIAGAGAGAGCGGEIEEPSASTTAPAVAAVQSAVKVDLPEGPAAEYVLTPSGRFHKSCVHEVPSGGEIDGAGGIHHGGRQVGRYEGCRFKAFRTHGAPDADTAAPAAAAPTDIVPTVNGWVERMYAFAPRTPAGFQWFNLMFASIFTPAVPLANGATIFFFPSFMPSGGNEIIQPVIQYGSSVAGGGNYWSAAAWYVDSAGNYFHSPLVRISPSDQIDGALLAVPNSCTNAGVCRWSMTMARGSTTLTSFIVQTDVPFTLADKAVLEAYNVTNCNQYPNQNATYYFGVRVYQPVSSISTYTEVTSSLSWTPKVYGGTPSCGYGVLMPGPSVGLLQF